MALLGFYEWLIVAMLIALAIILLFAVGSKVLSDKLRTWYDLERARLLEELDQFIGSPELPHYQSRCDAFLEKNYAVFGKKRYIELLEGILFETIEKHPEKAEGARKIAYELGLPPRSVINLKKRNDSRILYGCMQARSYLYEPALPYLIKQLEHPLMILQYDILLTLARFDRPDIIVEAFTIIEGSVLINERAIREIVRYSQGENRVVLYNSILDLDSDYLTAVFLKCIDTHTASVLSARITPLFSQANDKEVRIAAIKALTTAGDRKAVPSLLKALKDEEWELRAVAARSLAAIPDDRAFKPLLHAICDKEWWVRQNAATALLAYPKPEKGIAKVLEGDDTYAKESLVYAAHQNNMKDIVEYIDQSIQKKKTPRSTRPHKAPRKAVV